MHSSGGGKASLRDNTLKRDSLILLAAVLVVIAAVMISGVINNQKIWPDIQVNFRDNKTEFSIAEGDEYGRVTDGPYYDLPAGRYRFQWQVEGDGENLIRLSCSNGVSIEPSVFRTKAGEWKGEAEFELPEAVHNMSIDVEFVSGTWIKIYNFRLYSPEYTDDAWTLAFFLLALWGMYVLERKGKLAGWNWPVVLILGFAVAMVSVPSLEADCYHCDDLQFHAARIMNLADGLRSGQFPVRVGGFSYNGYGAATSVFYPDLPLYPLALLILGGASINYVIHLSCILTSVLSAATMYAAAKRIFEDRSAACCAALLFICSMFRLEDMYKRYMLGQMLAMACLPVFLLGIWEIIWGDWKRWPILTAGATLVFQSHMCTTLLCALLAVCICVVFAYRLIREKKRFGALCAAVGTTLLINLFTLVPFVMMYLDGVNTPTAQFGFLKSTTKIRNMIVLDGYMGRITWPAIVAAIAALLIEKNADYRKRALLFLTIGGVSAYAASELFPWGYVFELTHGLVEVIQFPWRFLVLATPCIALCGGYGLSRVFRRNKKTAVFAALMIAMSVWPYLNSVMDHDVLIEYGRSANPYMVYPEYQIEGTDVNETRSHEVIVEGEAEIIKYQKSGTQVDMQLDAKQNASLTFPLFGFDGYEVKLNGERIDWQRGENNRLTVEVPSGTQGMLQIRYKGKAVWRAADCISLIAAAVLFLYVRRKRVLYKTENPDPGHAYGA